MAQKNNQLGFNIKLAFGFGQAAEGLKNAAFGVFLFFLYNQVLGLAGWLTGLAIGIALVFDALTDPLVGSLSDNWRSRLGRRHPFMYAAALPLACAFYGLFNPPAMGELGLFWWLLGFAVLTRGAMTLYHVPHLALGAELSDDFHERTLVVAYRQFFSTCGQLSAYVIGFALFFVESPGHADGRFNLTAYSGYAAVLSVLMVISIVSSAWGTRGEVARLPQPKEKLKSFRPIFLLRKMIGELKSVMTSASFRWLFSGVLIVFMMVGTDSALNLHMNTYFWELASKGNLVFFSAMPIGVLTSAAFAHRLNRRFDKMPCFVMGLSIWSGCQIVPVVLRLLDWFPENGTGNLVVTLTSIRFLQGLGLAQALIAFGSMVADVVDEHELKTGLRQQGIFFAALAFSYKSTSGLGNLAGGLALDAINWPRGIEIQSAQDVPAETIIQLGLIYGPVVAGFAVLSIWCFSHYRLTRQRHQEVLSELEKIRVI